MGNVLIILGMHRSGTSLLTNWLYTMGLNVGDELLGASIGNLKGHFEDRKIFDVQEKILRKQGISSIEVGIDTVIDTNPLIKEAKKIIDSKNRLTQWGWKDPRTCLFLNVWRELIPNAKVIVIYRDYVLTVDSLIRRQKKIYSKRTNKVKALFDYFTKFRDQKISNTANRYLETWIRYNMEILEHIEKLDKEQYVVVNIKDLSNKGQQIFQIMNEKLNFDLEYVSIEQIFENKLLNTNPILSYGFRPDLLTKAEEVLNRLNNKCEADETD